MGRGKWAGDGMRQAEAGHHGVANKSEQGKLGNRKRQATAPWDQVNQSPWSGEPWANHAEPDHGEVGKMAWTLGWR